MRRCRGAVLVADVSGFTALTEALALGAQGSAGVELLTKCMNRYFTQVRTRAPVLGLRLSLLLAFYLPRIQAELTLASCLSCFCRTLLLPLSPGH